MLKSDILHKERCVSVYNPLTILLFLVDRFKLAQYRCVTYRYCFYILRFGLNHISAGTVDYTDGEDRRPNLLKGHSSVKSEAHKSLACG